MTEALLELLPDSPVYHVGMYRNPGSNIPVQYYNRLPKGHPSDVAFVLDPVIASCEHALRQPKQWSASLSSGAAQFVASVARTKDSIATPAVSNIQHPTSNDSEGAGGVTACGPACSRACSLQSKRYHNLLYSSSEGPRGFVQ